MTGRRTTADRARRIGWVASTFVLSMALVCGQAGLLTARADVPNPTAISRHGANGDTAEVKAPLPSARDRASEDVEATVPSAGAAAASTRSGPGDPRGSASGSGRGSRVSVPDPTPECGGVFSGTPSGSLTKSATTGGSALADGADVVTGQQVTFTITWDVDDWGAAELDKVADCFRVDGPGSDPDVSSLDAGEKPTDNDGSFSHTITVPSSLTPGEDRLCDRARLSDDSTTINVTTQKSNGLCLDVVSPVVSPVVDLEISKGPAGQTVSDGGTVTFDLTITNHGTAGATGVSVADTLPAGLTAQGVGYGPNAGNLSSCSNVSPINGQAVTCAIGSLDAGRSALVRITATETGGACEYTNSDATVSAQNETGTQHPNVSGSAVVTVTCAPDLTLTKAGPAAVDAGDEITWTVTVSNSGTDEAENVTLSDALPSGFVFVSSVPDDGGSPSSPPFCTESGGTVGCSLGTIAANGQTQVSITARAPDACGSFTNDVSGTYGSPPQPISGGSATSSGDVVGCSPDVELTKSSSTTSVSAGGSFGYTIEVSNTGNAPAQSVVVTDTVPTGLSITNVSGPGCSVSGQLVTCDVGTLVAGASASITITVTATDDACPSVSNTAHASFGAASSSTSNTVETDVDCVAGTAVAPTISPLGDQRADRTTLTPPGGTAFTGPDASTLRLGLTAIALLVVGAGLMFAGYRRRLRHEA